MLIAVTEPAKKEKEIPRCEKINIKYQKVTSVIFFSYTILHLQSS